MDDQNLENRQPEPQIPAQPAPRQEPPRYRESRRRPPIVGPVILIGLGLLFLAYNLGMVSMSTMVEAWRLWPLLLVLAGIEIVFGRTHWAATLGLTFVALAIVAFVSTMAFFMPWAAGSVSRGPVFESSTVEAASADTILEELGGAQSAVFNLRHGAGRLVIGALPSDSAQLVEGDLTHSAYTQIERSVNRQNGVVYVDLRNRTEGDVIHFGSRPGEDWNLDISPKVPAELSVHSGASDLNLDLRQLQITRLDIETGASAVRVTMPQAAGRTEGLIKAGAAGVDVRIPDGVGARIKVKGGLSGTDVDQGRFPKMGEYYQSPDYGTAQNRLDLEIDTGISGVTVR